MQQATQQPADAPSGGPVNDKQIAIAQVYAQAMLDLAEPQGNADEVLDELRWLSGQVASNAELARFTDSPLIDDADRAKSIEKMFRGRLSDMTVDALQVINRKGRLAFLGAITQAYQAKHRALRKRVDVEVVTATEIGDATLGRIREALVEYTGQEPDLRHRVDAGLIGGIVLRVGDEKADASVRSKIQTVQKLLAERSAREIHKRQGLVQS